MANWHAELADTHYIEDIEVRGAWTTGEARVGDAYSYRLSLGFGMKPSWTLDAFVILISNPLFDYNPVAQVLVKIYPASMTYPFTSDMKPISGQATTAAYQ